jgi:hypothetical protein
VARTLAEQVISETQRFKNGLTRKIGLSRLRLLRIRPDRLK